MLTSTLRPHSPHFTSTMSILVLNMRTHTHTHTQRGVSGLTLLIRNVQHFSHGLWHVQFMFLCHRLETQSSECQSAPVKPVKPALGTSDQTHRGGGDDLLGNHPQGVHHGDVAQPASDPQRRVPVLNGERASLAPQVASLAPQVAPAALSCSPDHTYTR